MIELILRDVDVGHIVVAAVEEMRQNHPVNRLMPDNHDILGVAVQEKHFFQAGFDARLHHRVAFPLWIGVVIFIGFTSAENFRHVFFDISISHALADTRVDFIKFFE